MSVFYTTGFVTGYVAQCLFIPDGFRRYILLPVAVTLILNAGILLYKFVSCPLRRIPGPQYSKATNLVLKWKVLSGQRSMYIDDLHRRYGPVVRIAPGETSVVNLESFVEIYKSTTTAPGFRKADWYADFVGIGPGNPPGLFTFAGHIEHGIRRRLLAPAFSNSSILKYESVIREKVNMAVDKIVAEATTDGVADILKWWTFMATDIIATLSFGDSFGMLERGKRNQYMTDVETIFMVSGLRVELPWLWSILSILPLASVKRLLGATQRIRTYGATAIGQLMHTARRSLSDDHSLPTNFFSHFLDAMEKNNSTLTALDITTEATNFIVAGSDSTGVNLTWLTWSLLHPNNVSSRQRLMAEIDAAADDLLAQDMLKLPFLNRCLDESLRLHGGSPTLPRVGPEGGMTAGGHFLPANTLVGSQSYSLQRDPEVFQQPLRFMPERWDTATTEMKEMFAPFSKGPRGCLGVHLAKLEMTMAIFTFFKRCRDIRLARQTTDKSMEFENYFLNVPKSHRCLVQL